MDNKTNDQVQKILGKADTGILDVLGEAIMAAEDGNVDLCKFFDGLSHILAQRVGHIEMIHLESDLNKGKWLDKNSLKITKDDLLKNVGTIQVNAIYSISRGMEDVLITGGHYTLKQLKEELKNDKIDTPHDLSLQMRKKKDDDSTSGSGGETVH